MAKKQQRFELYGGPLCGEVMDYEDVQGIHTLYIQPDTSPNVHVYSLRQCLPITPDGRKRKTKGFFYVGVQEDYFEELT